MSLEIGKMLWAKPRVSVNMRGSYVTNTQLLLTQRGHIDEQLKERLKSQKEENRNCPLKNVQSISYLSCQSIALRKGKHDEESNFKELLLSQAEDDEVLRKWIEKSYDTHMCPNAQNEILKIMALKVLHGIASGIAESGYYSIMGDESTDASNIEQRIICIRWMDSWRWQFARNILVWCLSLR